MLIEIVKMTSMATIQVVPPLLPSAMLAFLVDDFFAMTMCGLVLHLCIPLHTRAS